MNEAHPAGLVPDEAEAVRESATPRGRDRG